MFPEDGEGPWFSRLGFICGFEVCGLGLWGLGLRLLGLFGFGFLGCKVYGLEGALTKQLVTAILQLPVVIGS